jgi:hypothetical protein
MKATQKFLVFVFVLLSITSVSAQYGNNGYGNGGYGGSGRMNNGMSQMTQPSQPEKPKEIPVEVTAAKLVDDMKPALNLDELQVIAINNVLIESLREQGVLLKQQYSQEDQIKNFKALAETTDQKINQFLSKEQKEKYIVYKEERQNRKKTKEKPKSKEKKEKQE